MAFLCLLGCLFVAYKVLEEEYVLIKAGDAIDIRQWRSFRMAKLAARNLVVFVTGVLLFVGKMPFSKILVLMILYYLLIEFGARIFYKIKTRASDRSPSE